MSLAKKRNALKELETRVRRCRRCHLHKTRKNAVPGEGSVNAKIFLVGEAPGKAEDEQGMPFVGQAGRILDDSLDRAGLRRADVFMTSVLRCRPPDNRNPKASEIAACSLHLEKYIDAISPRVLVALGRYGLKGLTSKTGKLAELRKKRAKYGSIPVVVTYHPAAVLYNRNLMKVLVSDLKKAKRLSSK